MAHMNEDPRKRMTATEEDEETHEDGAEPSSSNTTTPAAATVPPIPGGSSMRQANFRAMVCKKLRSGGSEVLLNDRAITDADMVVLLEELKKHADACRKSPSGDAADDQQFSTAYYVPVTKLDLVGNFIGDKGCALLAVFLQSSDSSVTDLDLYGNEIHAAGCKALAGALCSGGSSSPTKGEGEGGHHLTVLDVRSNSIGPEGKALLIAAKKQRPSIAVYFDDMGNGGGHDGGGGGLLGLCGECIIS